MTVSVHLEKLRSVCLPKAETETNGETVLGPAARGYACRNMLSGYSQRQETGAAGTQTDRDDDDDDDDDASLSSDFFLETAARLMNPDCPVVAGYSLSPTANPANPTMPYGSCSAEGRDRRLIDRTGQFSRRAEPCPNVTCQGSN